MDIEDEVDVSNIFKQAASNLIGVTNLNDSLNRFGYSSDDRIERRELVLMYSSIEGEMEREISRLAHDGMYDAAKEMRSRLSSLKGEFNGLQTSGARLVRQEQLKLFEKACGELLKEVKAKHSRSKDEVNDVCERMRQDLKKTHSIQWENLERKISRIAKPPMKYSKRLIELFKAESGLIKLNEYEEARKVRYMIDKILPGEIRKHDEEFEEKNENKRRVLRAAQVEDIARLEEKLKALTWKNMRQCEREENQRIQNHLIDMTHTHSLENKLNPEMSVKPSALWQKRNGYQATSASMRGQQLLNCVRGKEMGDAVFADSLVDKHDFESPPLDTTILPTSGNQYY